jgi:hypothetical protein
LSAGSATVRQLLIIYRQQINNRQDIAEKTRICALGPPETVLMTWAASKRWRAPL